MAEITPGQAAAALDRLKGRLDEALQGVLRFAAVRIGGAAVARMRDAKGEPARRRPDDGGPLRIVTGTHAAATFVEGPNRLGSGRGGALNRIRARGAKAVLEKGYDLARDPGAYNEVRPDRARYRTLAPALDQEADRVRREAERVLTEALREAVA